MPKYLTLPLKRTIEQMRALYCLLLLCLAGGFWVDAQNLGNESGHSTKLLRIRVETEDARHPLVESDSTTFKQIIEKVRYIEGRVDWISDSVLFRGMKELPLTQTLAEADLPYNCLLNLERRRNLRKELRKDL